MQKLRQDVSIGGNLRRLRMAQGLTQDQVAAQIQVMGSDTTRSRYSRYETGELNIRVSDLVKLKTVFHCSYDEFFQGMDDNADPRMLK